MMAWFTQVSDSGPHGLLVFFKKVCCSRKKTQNPKSCFPLIKWQKNMEMKPNTLNLNFCSI